MKRYLLSLSMILIFTLSSLSQVTTLAPNYKVIDIGGNGYGDYTRSLILLHEIYNGTYIQKNYAVGTIQAFRGGSASWDRTNIVHVYTSSGYNGVNGSIQSFDNSGTWKLKTCVYNGRKYLAVDVPYDASYHDHGFKFCGWTYSTGENMKCVSYEVRGSAVNQDVISNVQDFSPNMSEYHNVGYFLISGNVLVGKTSPTNTAYKLDVGGKIRADEIVVNTTGADFVFDSTYNLRSLPELETFIKQNKHLPEIAPAKEMQENGVSAGEMQAKLLQKIEELTLYVIELKKENEELRTEKDVLNVKQQVQIQNLSLEIEKLKEILIKKSHE